MQTIIDFLARYVGDMPLNNNQMIPAMLTAFAVAMEFIASVISSLSKLGR